MDKRALILSVAVWAIMALAMACAPSLPEPESEAAQLYVKFCSGNGCHDPIPPQGSSAGYWKTQYDRMLPMMRDAGWAMPTPAEDRIVRDYIERFARKPGG